MVAFVACVYTVEQHIERISQYQPMLEVLAILAEYFGHSFFSFILSIKP
jgi:hypothetical protein